MSDFSLVLVDHLPDFEDASLVPVDHDPFGDNGTVQQAQTQQAQAQPVQPRQAEPQPQSPPQQPATGVGQSSAGAPADRSKAPLANPGYPSAPGDTFPTADAAAVAALQNINPTSQRYGLEYAGRVYHRWLGFGDYSYTPPTEGESYSSSPGYSALTLLHSLGVNAGAYHTHARGADPALNENYSTKDKQDSDSEGEPSYLGTPSGTIYKYSSIANQPSQGRISVLGKTSGPFDKSPGLR